MRWSGKYAALALGAVLVAGGCGDDGGPGGSDLTDSEKQALVNALTSADASFAGIAAFAVQAIGEVGKLNSAAVGHVVGRAINDAVRLSSNAIAADEYDAVGFAIDYTITTGTEVTQFWFVGVVGWNGISGNTVQELLLVGNAGFEGSLPSSATGTFEDFDVFGTYVNGTTSYDAVTGDATISTASFTGSDQDCGSASQQGIDYECDYRTGRMNGDFAFEAEQFGGTGTYTQSRVDFTDLPALRLTVVATYDVPAGR